MFPDRDYIQTLEVPGDLALCSIKYKYNESAIPQAPRTYNTDTEQDQPRLPRVPTFTHTADSI